MIFKFLEKKVTIDFFTDNPAVYHKAPITKANKQLPQWWKDLPANSGFNLNTFESENNMRRCIGLTSLFQQGFTVPMWTDLAIDISAFNQRGFRYELSASEMFSAEYHKEETRGSYAPEDKYSHLKLTSPWAAHCNKNINWLMIQSGWNFEDPSNLIIPTGCVNYNQISDTHINMLIPKQSERRQFMINYGQPMVQLIPLTERKVEMKTHLVSSEEYRRVIEGKNYSLSFSSTLYKGKKINQCPFNLKK